MSAKLTAETITIEQIQSLEIEAERSGDSRQVATCRDAIALLRLRHVGTAEWGVGNVPRELKSCVDAINAARALENT